MSPPPNDVLTQQPPAAPDPTTHPPPSDEVVTLLQARIRIRHLEQVRAAQQAALDALSIQAESDQVHVRVYKRRLAQSEAAAAAQTAELQAVATAASAERDLLQEQLAAIPITTPPPLPPPHQHADQVAQLQQRDAALRKLDARLRHEVAKTCAMELSMRELPQLRGLVSELRATLSEKERALQLLSPPEPSKKQGPTLSKAAVKKKLLELKIARMVITEKDKAVKEMRAVVSDSESRELESMLSRRLAEENVKSTENALKSTQQDLDLLSLKLAEERRLRKEHEVGVREAAAQVITLQEKLLEMEAQAQRHATMSEELEAAREELGSLEEEHKDYRDSSEKRLGIMQNQYTEAMSEVNKLKKALGESMKESTRLHDLVEKNALDIDDMGTTSPCSLGSTLEGHAVSSVSDCESLERLNELEEHAKHARVSYEQKCLEAHTLAASVSENASTIVTLNRALIVARQTGDDKHAQLEKSIAKASVLDKSVRKMRTDLAKKVQECAFLEKRIIDDLEPRLKQTTQMLHERTSEVKSMTVEYALHKEMAEKIQVALEEEVISMNGRLQNALNALSATQNRLLQSEEKGAELEVGIAALTNEKRDHLRTIDELRSDCQHRREALTSLQTRLGSTERHIAEKEQTALDAMQSREQLGTSLALAHDRQAVAEQRAARKDALALEMEERTKELLQNHQSIHRHLDDKTTALESAEQDVSELKQVVGVKEEALQKQANIARRREALFESLAIELRGVIESRDHALERTGEELRTVKRKANSVGETLSIVTENLKKTEEELASSQRNCGDLQAENRRLESKLCEVRDEACRLNAEYGAVQAELADKDKQISTQLLSLTEKGSEVAGLLAEKTELEKLVQHVQNELSAAHACSDRIACELAAMKQALSIAKTDVASCEEELSMRNSEVDSLSTSLASAQAEIDQMENVLGVKDDEIKNSTKVKRTLEIALERSKQQLRVLESHLDGHDTLLRDCREKEEALAVKCSEFDQAKEQIIEAEQNAISLREQFSAQVEEVHSLRIDNANLENARMELGQAFAEAEDAKECAENLCHTTTARLMALEKAANEEGKDLRATISSLKKVLDEKESSLTCTAETLSQSSIQGKLTKEQLIESRMRGDRLFARLTSAEYELASKKESLAALESRFREVQEKLEHRDAFVENLERKIQEQNQALSLARSRNDEVGNKAATIANGELLSLQTKLEAKENAIAHLHNWCCFINGKLHAAERGLSERDVDLEVSTMACRKLEAQVKRLNELLSEKECEVREIESSRVVEHSELRSRIQSLQAHAEETSVELDSNKLVILSDGSESQNSLLAASVEMGQCREKLKSKEMEVSQIQARCNSLQDTVKASERDLAAANRTIECLTLDVGVLRSEISGKEAKYCFEKKAAAEVSKVRSETAFLLVDLRRAEAELSAANENAETWKTKAEELQQIADSSFVAQRAAEMVSSRLALMEKDAKQRIDLLQTKLEEAKRERDVAERDCAAALADFATLRTRLTDADGRSGPTSLRGSSRLRTVVFTLQGIDAPNAEISVYILGDDATLGQWNPALKLPVRVVGKGRNGVIRKCDIVLPSYTRTKYKYAADGADGKLIWEGGENRVVEGNGAEAVTIEDIWRVAG